MLTVVFSYDRGELLSNCVRSLRRFPLEGELIVVDDASRDAATREVLAGLARSGLEVITAPTAERAHHGGLYDNMNLALREAERRGCALVHFVQDDMQQLWHRPDLAAHACELFEAFPDAAQLQVHFVKRLGKSRVEALPGRRAARVLTLPGDLGIFHAPRLRARGLAFGPSERAWGLRARALGLGVLATADPIVARVPWPRSARFGRMRGARIESEGDFLLELLGESRSAALQARDPAQRPWGEDWIVPNGWRCWRPFPHDDSRVQWAFALGRAAVLQRSLEGLIPQRVGSAPAGEGLAATHPLDSATR